MCTMVYSSLLLLILTIATISIMCGAKLEAEGLPVHRRERGTDEDILSGADFLSVLMRSVHYQSYTEATTPSATTKPVTLQPTTSESNEVYIRHSRSTPYFPEETELTSTGYNSAPLQSLEFDTTAESSHSTSDAVIVAVRVSTSVARSRPNEPTENSDKLDLRTSSTPYPSDVMTSSSSSSVAYDQKAIVSEERPSIVAGVSNSELSIDEGEPITTDTDLTAVEYPANVRQLPRPASFHDKLQPLHETLIYHDNPREPNRARSVSYSAVIQAVSHDESERNAWRAEKQQNLERRERHYDGTQPSSNAFPNAEEEKEKSNFTKSSPSAAETNHYFVTSNPENEQNLEKSWEEPKAYTQEITTTKTTETTEKNWEERDEPPSPPHSGLPRVYAQPEQNYEVDESVSVMSNGRVHGVQPQNTKQDQLKSTQPSKKSDDNQKVGYVVEGRNYRKYRVEERTSDGFIVGEYGVVSHDDGSLRGVRYTADGTINPRLIYDALMKFLSL